MKDYNKLINKLIRISLDMQWELLMEAAEAICELQQDAARYQWLRDQYPSNKDGYAIGYFDTCGVDAWQMTTPHLEEAIDAAMKGTE